MSDLPQLPAGFQLEANGPPPLPDGFQLEQQPSSIMDAIKGIPRNLLSGVMDAATSGAQAEAHAMSQPDLAAQIPDTAGAVKAMEPVTGQLYEPQTTLGKIVGAGARTVGNPASYVGPGGLILKAGGAALSGMGAEAAGQAAQGTPFEGPARLAGGLAGGIAAGKTLAPAAPQAAIPTAQELKAAAKAGYTQAAESGLKIAPSGLAQVAQNVEQELLREGFDPKGKVFGIIGEAQQVPTSPDQFVSSQSFDILNKRLKRIAQETQMGRSGPEPTADAAAASLALNRFQNYGQNIPARDVMAGSAPAYQDALGQANQNYAAYKRLQGADVRINKAENAADRQVAGSIANQIRLKVGGMLDNPRAMRGLTPDEISQLNLINGGNLWSNTLRQWGRGGAAHVIPAMGHVALAAKTGGASLPIWGSMIGARLADNAITRSRAQDFADMLAMRSPLYQQRVNALPPFDVSPNVAATIRGILGSLQ